MAKHENQEVRLGNYRILKLLGQGGFARVYLGEHIFLKRLTAIKLLNLGPDLSSGELEIFLAEARNLTSLEHDHIVRVFDFGVDRALPYLAMSYAPNGSLSQRHPLGTKLSSATITHYVSQIAAALQFTHDHKVIHCDVKPPNMLLDQDNKVLLSDFGIAIVVQNSIRTGDVIGTLHYMAPEQLDGKPQFASDQYALGVVVYSWLCGRLPFNVRTPSQLLQATPAPIQHFSPDVPRRVERVVMKALAKEPRQRFARIKDFAAALEEALQEQQDEQFAPTILPPPLPPTVLDSPLPPTVLPPPLLPTVPDRPSGPSRRHDAPPSPLPPIRLPSISSLQPDKTTYKDLWPPTQPALQGDTPPESHPPARSWGPRSLPLPLSPVHTTNSSSQIPDRSGSRTVYRGHTGWISTVAWSPSGQDIASGSWDTTVQIWDANSGEHKLTYRSHTQPVKAVAWSPDGSLLASGSWDKQVQVWHALTGEDLFSYNQHNSQIEDVAWSPDGRYIASADHDGTVQIWAAHNGSVSASYHEHSGPIWSISWSPDGQHIASASHDGTVRVWHVAMRKTIFTYHGHGEQQITAVAWSPNGRYIASADHQGTVQVWRAMDGNLLLHYQDAADAVKALSWSPDGQRLASAIKQVQVWNTATITATIPTSPTFTYTGHTNWVNALAWSPNGKQIASGGDDKSIQVWYS